MRTILPIYSLPGHDDFSNSCALGGYPWIILSTGDDKRVRLWHIESDRPSGEVLAKLSDSAWKCALSEDGRIAAAACNDGSVSVWDTVNRKKIHSFRHPGFDTAFGVDITPNANFLAASFFNSHTGEGLVVRYCFPPDSHEAYEQNSWSAPMSWNHANIRISRTGDIVAIASSEGLFVFEGSEGSLLFSCSKFSSDFDIAISAYGRRVAVADKSSLRIFFQTSQSSTPLWKVRTYEGYSSPISPSCSFSANGRTVLAAMSDGSFRVWSIFERYPLISLEGHSAPGTGCAIDCTGSTAVTTSVDHTVKIWNLTESEGKKENLSEKRNEINQESSTKQEKESETEAKDDDADSHQPKNTNVTEVKTDSFCNTCAGTVIDSTHSTPESSLQELEVQFGSETRCFLNPEGSRLIFAITHMANHWSKRLSGNEIG